MALKIFERSNPTKVIHIFSSPAGDMLFLRIISFFSLLHIPNFIFGDRTASAKSARFCQRFGGKTINSLNGANSTCPAHPEFIVTDFLVGTASSALTRKQEISLGDISVILQNHFRSLMISRIQQSPSGGQRIDRDDPTCLNLTRALHDLRDKIPGKEKQIFTGNESIQEAERWLGGLTITIRQKDQDIHESNEKLRQIEDAIIKTIERQLELNIQREREITELPIAIAGLEQEISTEKADIAVFEPQLQRRFTAPDHRLLTAIDISPNWKLDREVLTRIVEASSFLFSMALFDGFLSICTVREAFWALTFAFEDFSQFQGRQW